MSGWYLTMEVEAEVLSVGQWLKEEPPWLMVGNTWLGL